MQAGKAQLILLFLLLPLIIPKEGAGQRSAAYYLATDHHHALDLFDKQKYAAAQTAFDRVVEEQDRNDLIRIAAEYYSARCAMELYNRDAEEKMENFVAEHPDSPWLTEAHFQLGRYLFQRRRYDKAIANFEKVKEKELQEKDLHEMVFKKGYAQFQEDAFEEARRSFYRLKDQEEGDYYGPSNYYFAHIHYRQGNHQTALEHFERVREHPNFKGIVPYYLTQIHYLLGNYEVIIETAPPFLDSSGTERPLEIARIIGESYYRTDRFEEAVPYLERYIKGSYGINREDRYQVGFAQMKAGDAEKALEHFEKVVDREDSLAQVAYYHMATIHAEQEEKKRALNAFHSASQLHHNERIREDALFQYAKLSYELSYDPYDQAVRALKTYIEEYPDSERKEEALGYLTDLYMSSRDLEQALSSMERMEKKDLRMRTAYQIVAFDRGVELFLEGRYGKAIELFEKARIYPLDRSLNAKSLYWKAQCYAEKGRTKEALQGFEEFRAEPGAYSLPWYERSYYDAGYVLFRDSLYEQAAAEFRKFAEGADSKEHKRELGDAYQRIGDSYYLIKDYKRAERFYQKATELREAPGRDRALYQMAVCNGLNDDPEKKVAALKRLLKEFPGSEFREQSKLQLGRTYVRMGRSDEAIASYRDLIGKRPESFAAHKARLQLGLLLYQGEQPEKAIQRFKEVIEARPGYELSREALNRLRDIHVDLGRMEAYNDYVAGLEGLDVDQEEMDEANYSSAEKLFLNGNYRKAIPAFRKYLKEFDPALYELNARFYLAEALRMSGKGEEAIGAYEKVIERGPNPFYLSALEHGADLNFKKGKWERSLAHYQDLEQESNSGELTLKALKGQLSCSRKLDEEEGILKASERILKHDKSGNKEIVAALMSKGKVLEKRGKLQEARKNYFRVVDTTSSEAKAEARYRIARTYFEEGRHDSTESTIFKLVHQKPSYKEWVAKGFLLLADSYREVGDLYQAKETLKSLVDHYEGEELVRKAEKRLNEIRKEEREKEQKERPDSSEQSIGTERDSILKDR